MTVMNFQLSLITNDIIQRTPIQKGNIQKEMHTQQLWHVAEGYI